MTLSPAASRSATHHPASQNQVARSSSAFDRLIDLSNSSTPSTPLTLGLNEVGVRGVFVSGAPGEEKTSVGEGEVLLSVPLSSCVVADWRDDGGAVVDGEDDAEAKELREADWPYRIGSSFLRASCAPHMDAWKELLPSPTDLTSCLPWYWPSDALDLAGSEALTLNAAARRDQAAERAARLARSLSGGDGTTGSEETDVSEALHAIHLAHTRTCEVKHGTRRGYAFAPVFDMINHAPPAGYDDSVDAAGTGGDVPGCNAGYDLERIVAGNSPVDAERRIQGGEADVDDDRAAYHLVVRSTAVIQPGEEILIDYGASAKGWVCLLNYGFVPPGFVADAAAVELANGNKYVLTNTDVQTKEELDVLPTFTRKYGIGTGLLGAAADAVRERLWLGPLGENEPLVLDGPVASYLVEVFDRALVRLEGTSSDPVSQTSDPASSLTEEDDGPLAFALAASLQSSNRALIRRCRDRLVRDFDIIK